MKIGILTLPFNNNYGGYLQSIALYHVLKSNGLDPIVINRRKNKYKISEQIHYFYWGLKGVIKRSRKQPFFLDTEKDFLWRGQLMIPFVEKNIRLSDKIYSSCELEEFFNNNCSALVVGSDQVWRPGFVPDIPDYFFDIVKGPQKKIAYGVSFGNSSPNFTKAEVKKIQSLYSQIDFIGFREDSGKKVCNSFGWKNNNEHVVLDPTMLMPPEFYISLINKDDIVSTHNLFCYILDYNMTLVNGIKLVADYIKEDPYYILDPKKWKDKRYIMPKIEDWLLGIKNAKNVITDSFHGAVFSIIFNKPFIVFANKVRGLDRFETLLGHFGLLDRIVYDEKDFVSTFNKPIDWDDVNKRLLEKRRQSLRLLLNSFE